MVEFRVPINLVIKVKDIDAMEEYWESAGDVEWKDVPEQFKDNPIKGFTNRVYEYLNVWDDVMSEIHNRLVFEKYGDDITITTNPTTGISTIEVHFAELSSVQGTYVIEYEVKAKDDYNGAMFTNESATLTATATEDNTYYDKNTTDEEGNPVIDKSIELTFDKPVVAIALATKDDDLTSNKIDEGEKVIISQETILGNDRVNEKLEEPYYAPESGVLNSNVLDSSVNHTIKIKNVSCGIAKVNDEGNIEYTATVGCVGNPTIEYYVESDVYIYDNTLLNNKLYEVTSVGVKYNEDGSVKEYTETSTITLNVVKVPTSYTVQYLDKDTNKEVADSKVVDANVYDSVTEKAIEVEKYNLAEGEEVEKTITSLAKDASSNVIVFYYTKKPAELVTPDFEKTASVEGNKVTVVVGSVEHPMIDVHYIEMILIETKKGVQVKYLNPGERPYAEFILEDDEFVAAYEYCNLHGLWKYEV